MYQFCYDVYYNDFMFCTHLIDYCVELNEILPLIRKHISKGKNVSGFSITRIVEVDPKYYDA